MEEINPEKYYVLFRDFTIFVWVFHFVCVCQCDLFCLEKHETNTLFTFFVVLNTVYYYDYNVFFCVRLQYGRGFRVFFSCAFCFNE